MSDAATLVPPPKAGAADAPPGLVGAVDNVGAEKIYGWAWHPGRPAERLRIEARLGAEVAVAARADFARPDLPGAGVGDGNHAFELKLTPACIARKAELAIVAIAGDGSELKLPFRVKRTPAIAAAESRREVEQLAAAQREMREEMRAAIAGLARAPRGGEAGMAAAMQVATTQAKLEERLGTLDLWLTRLDARLAALAEAQAAAAPRRRVDPWQVVLGAVLALVGGAGLGAALLLLGPGWLG
ncbi:hypothetical protein [Falsiroseomonas sp. CW058]|uniref:hypothetical protein n=1 Tax=Falsiroseomonas sp. CW058 TaxID=3388664 RepID=UPI003D3201C3